MMIICEGDCGVLEVRFPCNLILEVDTNLGHVVVSSTDSFFTSPI